MNITHKQLKAFVAVARSQSFAEACREIHLSQPALSIAIKNLEEAVGGQLFYRTTRAVSLTPDGDAFYPVAKRLLADWDNAFEALHNRFSKQRGKLSIAAMPSFACNQLPDILAGFQKENSSTNITVDDVVAEEVVALVAKGRVEFGICFDPGESEDLHFQPFFNDHFIAVMSQNEAREMPDVIDWSSLSKKNFIMLQRPSSIRLQIEQLMKEHGIVLDVVYEAHQLATIGRMVASGLGISFVPKLCLQQFEEMGVAWRPVETPGISRKVGILTRKNAVLSEAAEQLKEALVSRY